MTNEDLKKKIADIVEANSMCPDEGECRTCKYNKELYDDSDNPYYSCITLKVVDALIAAGLRFGENLTATFDHMALEREHELEHRLAEAEHRAEVAERALDLCETAYILSLNHRATEDISGQAIASDLGVHKFFMEQAEKELAEEEKDGKMR